MILIIGGAHQGKLQFAEQAFADRTVFQCSIDNPELDLSYGIINSVHFLILAQMRAGLDPEAIFSSQTGDLADKVLICDDISSGIVPLDREMRLWRDTTGRILARLSQQSEQVYRVFCGISSRLK
ncbi:MAG: bifunctional adenosylcobinamide kinase/adenosylcobinamide-phosphate guanylyltransferase [Coriobacteriia bacterium]|nr:bifunctional adenosylcobinamide kinase/adenosylcobinamide-phosphate guanylyltransferase [Coriobacteriia bacterium]